MSWQDDFLADSQSQFIDAYEEIVGVENAFYELPEAIRAAILGAVQVLAKTHLPDETDGGND